MTCVHNLSNNQSVVLRVLRQQADRSMYIVIKSAAAAAVAVRAAESRGRLQITVVFTLLYKTDTLDTKHATRQHVDQHCLQTTRSEVVTRDT